jgi:putative addiction module CopG family antidote
MSKTYSPGAEADAIIERQLAKGNYGTPDEVVSTGVRLLEEREAELEELRALIDKGDAAYARGNYSSYASADQFLADIKRLGEIQSPQKR